MKEKFSCTSCKYRFTRSHQPNLCPFCGQQAVVPDVSPSAERLVQEVGELQAEFSRR